MPTLPVRRLAPQLIAGVVAFATPLLGQATEVAVEELIERGLHEEALAALEDRLAERPDDPEARFLAGIVLAELERTDEAIEVFSRLAAEHPDLPGPHNNLAVLYALAGDYEAARRALTAAIEADPDNSRYHENLGDLYANLAIESYSRALESGDAGGGAEVKLDSLRRLLERVPAGSDPPSGAPAPPRDADCAAVLTTLDAWAAAWSKADFEAYVAFYSPSFVPPHKLSRAGWESIRRHRLARPRFIEVTLVEPRIEQCSKQEARVRLVQLYRSDLFEDRETKEIILERQGAQWRIVGERSVG